MLIQYAIFKIMQTIFDWAFGFESTNQTGLRSEPIVGLASHPRILTDVGEIGTRVPLYGALSCKMSTRRCSVV